MKLLSILRKYEEVGKAPKGAVSPTNIETEPETAPALNVAALEERLDEIHSNIPSIASEFKEWSGFLAVVLSIVTRMQRASAWFDADGCHELVITATELKDVMRQFSVPYFTAEFRDMMSTWDTWIQEMIRQAITRLSDRNKDRTAKLAELPGKIKKLQRELYVHEWRLTGGMAKVTPINYKQLRNSVAVTFCAMVVAEGLGGYGMFESKGDPMSAVVWSLMNVVVLTGLTYLAATNFAIVYANNDANVGRPSLKIFDSAGKQIVIYPYPLPQSTRTIAQLARILLGIWSVGLMVWRIYQAVNDTVEFGYNMVFGSAVMVMLAWFYYAYEIKKAPRYEKPFQLEWQRLTSEIKTMQEQIKNTKAADVDAEYLKERGEAVAKYNEAVAGAKKQIKKVLEGHRKLALRYLTLLDLYRDVYRKLLPQTFRRLVQEAAAYLESNKIASHTDLDTTDIAERAKKTYNSAVTPNLEDPELEQQSRTFDFTVDLSNVGILDVAALESAAKMQQKTSVTRPATAGAAPLENWT